MLWISSNGIMCRLILLRLFTEPEIYTPDILIVAMANELKIDYNEKV